MTPATGPTALLNPRSESLLITRWAQQIRSPRLRTIGEFAEAEIVLPDGPHMGRRFRLDRSPVARLLFAEMDSGKWWRIFTTGPNQDGKSLLGFVIPTLYLLFERRETVILGVPSMDLVSDKWSMDLLPVIAASRFKSLLPQKGKGSRDGESILIKFGNGARLRFMTAGGGDQSRAGFTTPNLVVTETDGFDQTGSTSREGTKFGQLEKRLLAFEDVGYRLYSECTVSTKKGRTWHEYTNGTQSRIVLQCPGCRAWVTPEREHLVGWQDAESEPAAIAAAAIVCPACGVLWTNQQRLEANHHAKLLHRGQSISNDGTISGELSATRTLGFRWTVVNTTLAPGRLSKVAGREWAARRAADEEAAEKDLKQAHWALPVAPAQVDLSQLDAAVIQQRLLAKVTRGQVPPGTMWITVGIDVGKWLCHWTAIAWRPDATPHVLDYGRIEVPSAQMAEEDAILLALRDFRDSVLKPGWIFGDGPAAKPMQPVFTFVDCGNWQSTVLIFCVESGAGVYGTKGFGSGQSRKVAAARVTGTKVLEVRENYSLVRLPTGNEIIEVSTDPWKSWLHARLQTPLRTADGSESAGALTLFDSRDHLSFSKHLVAERKVEEFVAGKGTVTRWEQVARSNHYLDSTTLACVAGHAAGARLITPPAGPTPVQRPEPTRPEWMPERPTTWLK